MQEVLKMSMTIEIANKIDLQGFLTELGAYEVAIEGYKVIVRGVKNE